MLEKALKCTTLILPIGQASDSAHLANERIRIENLTRGITLFSIFFQNIAEIGKQKHTNEFSPLSVDPN